MARPIDADALVEWLTKSTGFMANCEDCTEIDCLYCIIHEAIMNAPTIEAEPVKHGHWNLVSRKNIWDDLVDVFECSECKKYTTNGRGNTSPTDFCPNCGARMDGE